MILFLYGEDSFRSREKLHELKNGYLEKNPSSGLFECESDVVNAIEILRVALTETGLFATKKLVIAKNFLEMSLSMQESLLDFLKQRWEKIEEDKDTILIFWEASLPKKTNKMMKFLEKTVAKKQQFDVLRGIRLEQWIIHRVHLIDAKTNIEKKALPWLAFELGDDLTALDNELRKLVEFCEDNLIRESDAKTFVEKSVKTLVFEALEALSMGKRAQALALFEDQLKKGENALYLLSMCAWQLRSLAKVEDGFSRGTRTAVALANECKIHPFVAQKLLRQIQGFSKERLRQAFALIATLDTKSKSGQIEPKLALNFFILQV
jgi:DNA polymerase-3 subunit delta